MLRSDCEERASGSSIKSISSSESTYSTKSFDSKQELCTFFLKVGSCRHGEKCSRAHVSIKRSKNLGAKILLKENNTDLYEFDEQKHFEHFYFETFVEICQQYGKIKHLHVCENIGDHMHGNVYVRFRSENAAIRAIEDLNKRWFAGRPIYAQFSPVSDFRGSAICHQFQNGKCERGHYCNFLHLRPIPKSLKKLVKSELRRLTLSNAIKRLKYERKKSTESSFHDLSPASFECELSDNSFYKIDGHSSKTASESSPDKSNFQSNLPKAFKDTLVEKRRHSKKCSINISTDSEISDHEAEIVQKSRQIERQQRWQIFKHKLLIDDLANLADANKLDEEEWNELKERNFIFDLL